jgi:DNA-binding PadR family transcriptional regulator
VKPEINQLLPLTPAVFQILLALSDGPKHGYLIMKEVESSTDNMIPMGPGTLYGSIKRMIEAGLIIETTSPPTEKDQRRRYYKLNHFGRMVLEAELNRLQKQLLIAQKKNILGSFNRG